MKKKIVFVIWIAMLMCMLPTALWAWCWVRDSGNTEAGCSAGDVQQDCCTGNLRKWSAGSMDYNITDPIDSTLEGYIDAGFARWNDLVMSTFRFNKLGTTETEIIANDGTNIVNIDSNFCDNTGIPCGQGVLGVSGTFTTAPGSGYEAVGSDIILNAVDFTWGDGTGGTEDTEAVIAHESGHSAGLSHPGATCRSPGSSGCGPEVPAATMYWSFGGGQPTDKVTLELDDVAALVSGYPRSSFRVNVVNTSDEAIVGAQVELLDSAAPINGSTIASGGSVLGDVTDSNVLFGNDATSPSYSTESPFSDTDADGFTNFINPVHQSVDVRATAGDNPAVQIDNHTVAANSSTLEIIVGTAETDFAGPAITVTSHSNGDSVGDPVITIAGTATDVGRGDNGVSQVTVDGVEADVTGTDPLSWSRSITLDEGANAIEIVATDNKSTIKNNTTQTITITYDTIPPVVNSVAPADGATDVEINTAIVARFNEALEASTITASTFTVDNGITGSTSYDGDTFVASLVPSANLAYSTTYTVTVTTGVLDANGNALASDFVWSFTTRSRPKGSGGGGSGCLIDTAARP